MPGHTPGLVGTLIQNNGKFLLLTADCGYAHKSWERMILPGVISDRQEIVSAFQWINEMAQKENCIACLANHETDLPSRMIEL